MRFFQPGRAISSSFPAFHLLGRKFLRPGFPLASMGLDTQEDAAGDGWSDEEIEALLGTLILLGIATAAAYFLFLRPAVAGGAGRGDGGRQQARAVVGAPGARPRQAAAAIPEPPLAASTANVDRRNGQPARNHGGRDNPPPSGSIPSIIAQGKRRPPHLVTTHPGGPSSSSCLVEGIIPFRRTHANGYEANLVQDQPQRQQGEDGGAVSIRRSRARLFARLLNSSITGAKSNTPPARGSNVVVSIPSGDVACPKLQHALWLLGTYYNLFVVLCLSSTSEEGGGGVDVSEKERSMLCGLRSSLRSQGAGSEGRQVSQEILPDHRIVAVRTLGGRVAFVRQMHRPEFVLDFDSEIRVQLERFGFTVLLYGQGREQKQGEGSLLGNALMA